MKLFYDKEIRSKKQQNFQESLADADMKLKAIARDLETLKEEVYINF